jgi:uroporphyrinogen decarboxylase
MELTSRERVLAAIRHEVPDLVPATIYIDQNLRTRLLNDPAGRTVLSHFEDDTIRILWEVESVCVDETTFRDRFGVLWKRTGSAYFHQDPPLSEPDASRIPRIQLLPEGEVKRIQDIRAQNPDKFIYYQFTLTFSERLWALRGFEQYLMDLADQPQFVHDALDILLQMHQEALDVLVKQPVDGITFGDDFGSQRGLLISPASFREFFKERLGSLYARVRDAGLVVGAHSCGDNTAIMGDYVDIGLQVFHPLQSECMDIGQIKREFGRDLTFRGGMGVQGPVVYGTPDEVWDFVHTSVRTLAAGGGYLMEPCKPLPPETPLANAIAFLEAMHSARRQFN